MAKYRKVDPFVWNDKKFRELSDDGKLVFFFLLTHPHMTSLGAMRTTVAGLAAELGWPMKGFREGFQEVLGKGMAKYDETACFVWLPKFLKHNPPENPNVVKAFSNALDVLPECDLLTELLQGFAELMKGYSKGFQEAFDKGFGKALRKGMANPEPEPEPEPEIEDSLRSSSCAEPESDSTQQLHLAGTLPLNDGSVFEIRQALLDELVPLYPAVDVVQELRAMKGWLIGNPIKRKTKAGVKRFITNWLARAQDKGGKGGQALHQPGNPLSIKGQQSAQNLQGFVHRKSNQ